jgi:hypothetical protein
MADYGRQVSMASGLDSQHTEARLGIMEGHSLNDAGENFLIGLTCSGWCSHRLDCSDRVEGLKLVAAGISPTRAAMQLGLARSAVYREVSRAGIIRLIA